MKVFYAAIAVMLVIVITRLEFEENFEDWDNPLKPFTAKDERVFDGPIAIEWRTADDVTEACDKASKEFGNNGFAEGQINGCAFHWGEKCVIITKTRPTMHTVGHEIRHCFYGAWH